jgi:adenylate kinase family enzyme
VAGTHYIGNKRVQSRKSANVQLAVKNGTPVADVVFVLGGPGAGKGTQCARIVDAFGFVHLSAGDLLRAERKRGTANAELINNYIKEGKIVPVEITIGLIKVAMEEHVAEGRSRFLIDGFPRNANNLEGWDALMSDYAKVHFCLFLDCPEDVMQTRLLVRAPTHPHARAPTSSTLLSLFRFSGPCSPRLACSL